MNFDVIIIGSGFGGAVHACRLAEKGRNVLVLERGRRWEPENYPRSVDDAWIFDTDAPHERNGWMDLRIYKKMWVVSGAGVGGGSLIYANVSIDAKPEMLDSGWPSPISSASLAPYYLRVAGMLRPEKIPSGQHTPRYYLIRNAAKKIDAINRFKKLDLAVSFDPNGSFPRRRPDSEEATKTLNNVFGRKQGYCVHAGNCVVGCKAQAKNSLDLNYLAVAEKNGAEIRPLAMVSHIVPQDRRYDVVYHDISEGQRIKRVAHARQVVVAAGSLGSTEIIFRSRDKFRTLPNVSAVLGCGWSANGDLLTPAVYNRLLSPTIGPTITAAIDFLDGRNGGAQYFVEDGGFPDVLGNALRALKGRRIGVRVLSRILSALDDGNPVESMMPWFGQAIDGGDGQLRWGRDWLRPWRKKRMKLKWDPARSRLGVNGLIDSHEQLINVTGGRTLELKKVLRKWGVPGNLVTPHPLGGCRMGASPSLGVVDHRGQVFGHPGLFVSDGSVVPRPIGLNPSKTIAALAERSAEMMLNP